MVTLWAVLPGDIDDPAAPSGGNRYDRTVLSLLPDVHEIAVPGSWPTPSDATRATLGHALSEIPDMSDVLVDGLVGCGVPEALAPHATRLRLIMLVHLPLSDETGLSPGEADDLRERERRALHLATTVIATSSAAADRVAGMHGLAHVAIAPPGVEPAPLAEPDPAGRRLLCVAAVTPRKGQDLLVGALEEDLAGLDWTCTFAGALVRPVPHTDPRLHFAGPLGDGALAKAYGETDLLILPSRAETYGMVVTEALARGIPVLASDVGGVSEALGTAPDGTRPGLLVPPGDRTALAAALRSWLTGAALRDRLRTAAHARRDTLPGWDETARRLDTACRPA
ncbi:glycosyltransferase family 4 protein [Actinoplanes bogorensis]|uniref:Glycosyltransferase family 4 protein n=1 Tax=Paractinoplanes bogorensis TaxID=1610840 RepID=A0ABS5YQS4_9ACTN|nr:glycosyltransferase family 4 protein [Actinoplanes bogorensis]MBU2664365.1 glycosyltransferase family 4 protein [Actinoplanes bogorensis]